MLAVRKLLQRLIGSRTMEKNLGLTDVEMYLYEHGLPSSVSLVGGPYDGLHVTPHTVYEIACLPTSPELIDRPEGLNDWHLRETPFSSLAIYSLAVNSDRLTYQFQHCIVP